MMRKNWIAILSFRTLTTARVFVFTCLLTFLLVNCAPAAPIAPAAPVAPATPTDFPEFLEAFNYSESHNQNFINKDAIFWFLIDDSKSTTGELGSPKCPSGTSPDYKFAVYSLLRILDRSLLPQEKKGLKIAISQFGDRYDEVVSLKLFSEVTESDYSRIKNQPDDDDTMYLDAFEQVALKVGKENTAYVFLATDGMAVKQENELKKLLRGYPNIQIVVGLNCPNSLEITSSDYKFWEDLKNVKEIGSVQAIYESFLKLAGLSEAGLDRMWGTYKQEGIRFELPGDTAKGYLSFLSLEGEQTFIEFVCNDGEKDHQVRFTSGNDFDLKPKSDCEPHVCVSRSQPLPQGIWYMEASRPTLKNIQIRQLDFLTNFQPTTLEVVIHSDNDNFDQWATCYSPQLEPNFAGILDLKRSESEECRKDKQICNRWQIERLLLPYDDLSNRLLAKNTTLSVGVFIDYAQLLEEMDESLTEEYSKKSAGQYEIKYRYQPQAKFYSISPKEVQLRVEGEVYPPKIWAVRSQIWVTPTTPPTYTPRPVSCPSITGNKDGMQFLSLLDGSLRNSDLRVGSIVFVSTISEENVSGYKILGIDNLVRCGYEYIFAEWDTRDSQMFYQSEKFDMLQQN